MTDLTERHLSNPSKLIRFAHKAAVFAAHYIFWLVLLLLILRAFSENLGAFQVFRYAGF